MTHITRVFNVETRSLTNVERRYAGQVGDALATVIHFEYNPPEFPYDYVPYIMFGVQDDEGKPLIFGPPPTKPPALMHNVFEERVYFDGTTFALPWSVTSRARSARVEYQLFFVKKGVEFDGRNVAKLKPTEIVMSAIDVIALKPSIGCKRPGPGASPCAPPKHGCMSPPFAPTGAEPDIIGYINLWKEWGLVVPVDQELDEPIFVDRFGVPYEPTEQERMENPPVVVLKFHTYNGNCDSYTVL